MTNRFERQRLHYCRRILAWPVGYADSKALVPSEDELRRAVVGMMAIANAVTQAKALLWRPPVDEVDDVPS
jgi:hypothetical protein